MADLTDTANGIPSEAKGIGFRDKIGYMFGDFGNDFFFNMTSMFLMLFYTEVMGIDAAIAGVLFLVARLWDAVADVLVGRFIDSRKPTKNGKFRVWMLRAAPLMLIFGILTFLKIPGLSNTLYIVYAFATYILWGSLYSAVNIPFGSMASVITSDPVERTSLSTFRTVGGYLAAMVVGIVTPLIVFVNNKASSGRFAIIAIAFAALSMISYVLCYSLVRERLVDNVRHEFNFAKTLAIFAKNKVLIVILVVNLLNVLTTILGATINAYVYQFYFQAAKVLSVANLLNVAVIFIIGPSIGPLVKKFGKKETASAGLLISGFLFVVVFLIPIHNAYLFAALFFVSMLGQMYYQFSSWAFIVDAIDYQELLSGEREDGTVYAFVSFIRKVAQALAGGLGGFALAAIGFVASAPTQTHQFATHVKALAILSPAVGGIASFLVLLLFYPLTKQKTQQLSTDLASRHVGPGNDGSPE